MSRVDRAARLASVLAIGAALAGCGGDTSGNEAGSGPPGVVAPLNVADCADWNEASVEERLSTVGEIRRYTGGRVAGAGGEGVVLSDERAYDLFENYCANEFARGFKLYKLYGRAAAFDGR